jgi:hypothetical protein
MVKNCGVAIRCNDSGHNPYIGQQMPRRHLQGPTGIPDMPGGSLIHWPDDLQRRARGRRGMASSGWVDYSFAFEELPLVWCERAFLPPQHSSDRFSRGYKTHNGIRWVMSLWQNPSAGDLTARIAVRPDRGCHWLWGGCGGLRAGGFDPLRPWQGGRVAPTSVFGCFPFV